MDLNLMSNFSMRSDATLQKEALAYFERLKNDSCGWRVCVDALLQSPQPIDESSVFFCLQVIENHVKMRYENDCPEARLAFRSFIFTWFTSNHKDTSNYILNKFAYIVNSVFLIDFPSQKWNTFFSDFLALCQTQQNCDLFLRILLQINADVADREIPRSQKEMERNTTIKDMMRETCLLDLANFWFNIIQTYRESASPTVCLCLEVMGAYVAWIDISLITNDTIMSHLFNLFSDRTFRCSVIDCFNGILHKGMEPYAKTQLIEQFMSVESIKVTLMEICNSPISNETNEEDEQLLFTIKFCKLMNTIGLELIESLKKCKSKQNEKVTGGVSDEDMQAINFISSAIETKFAILCQFLSHKCNNVSLQIHAFSREYIQWIKHNTCSSSSKTANKCPSITSISSASSHYVNSTAEEKLIYILRIIIEKCKYARGFDFAANNEDESDFDEFRKSCKVLFDNLMLVNSGTIITFICDQLVEPMLLNWRASNAPFPDVEIALYYFYLIGENLNLMTDQKKVESLLQLLITSSISSFPHCSIQSIYFDLVLRYEKFFSNNLNYLVPQILMSFLDERGFKNQSPVMRSKVSHLFNKFVKSQIKSKFNDKQQSFTDDILKRLQDFLKHDITYDDEDEEMMCKASKKKVVSIFDDVKYPIKHEDQLYVFETAAVLIVSNHNFDNSKKQLLLKNLLLQPIWENFDEIYAKLSAPIMLNGTGGVHVNGDLQSINNEELARKKLCVKMAHFISLASRTSKAFSNVQTIKSVGAQPIYLDSFNLFVKAVTLNLNEELLYIIQSSTRQFLHRLIVCLDESEVIPMLPVAIERLFLANSQQPNAKTIQELVPLINQVVTKFKHSWLFQRDLMPFLKQIFLPLVSSFFTVISQASVSTDERLSLQKSYYLFLSVLVTNNVMDVFSGIDISMMEQILMTVLQGSVDFPDSLTQKTCFQILKKFVEFFGTTSSVTNGSIAKPINQPVVSPIPLVGFVEFIYKSIVPACFHAPLRHPDDAQLMNECLLCLKTVMLTRNSEEFVVYLRTQFFPQHFPNMSNSEELIESLVNSEMKVSKNAFKQFCQQMKQNDPNIT